MDVIGATSLFTEDRTGIFNLTTMEDQIVDARFSTFPRFPYTHTDETAQPKLWL